ncbi:HAMP domain-containing sensor histidine kinase [Vagococcus carniphilus]|uniref:histidine kinase n=1 Tax=Vagococcus carniphilus TaxID=218144 RepID=A0AAW8TZW1_9ENTE|nr:HAMP domain-containing sensor histidine kinase [Vagococcus carniphilus]MDT2815928.1 HAMP domain-containing sensor histidine kinase [Vagococcus carniphilus]MDT2831394.1 HAMP domain-containing sensor histidine kinase [Vagococcus carniphilus]MDT2832833.1 HAMP domain-containing sensor histidine kinase [Vagococcus carniphilus]MDT2840272.1 HAMP domain-containing sensor histidine kinase [Vagococcus carniphilus]MDT2850090.1 HAMP domain-containing sensor histidine kinase [Vagococcus carniphilus]
MAIKLKDKQKKHNRIVLTSKEKSELLIEGIVTIILLILLNLAMYMLLIQIVQSSLSIENMISNISTSIYDTFYSPTSYAWKKPIFFLLGIIDLSILYWRLIRRYRQMQQRHIISELHYISNGHYDHRIPFDLSGDSGKLIRSINALVDSTVEAIEEERRIEQSKDELITNVSHDIRTPLTSIIGYLGLIEEKKYSSDEELLKYTHTAYMKARQMKVLVDDLFEYTKVRQSNTPLSIMTFDMQQLIGQVVVDFELEASKKNVTVDFEASPASLMMEGDTEKLVRVFDNLLSNALKYGVNGKQIVIHSEKIGSEVVITVKNDGKEIPKQSLDLLFDRFYRVEESRSQQTGGTGLGLAIAQSIVTLHNGYIYATSENGWTSFVIHLPLKSTEI